MAEQEINVYTELELLYHTKFQCGHVIFHSGLIREYGEGGRLSGDAPLLTSSCVGGMNAADMHACMLNCLFIICPEVVCIYTL